MKKKYQKEILKQNKVCKLYHDRKEKEEYTVKKINKLYQEEDVLGLIEDNIQTKILCKLRAKS